MVRTQRQIAEAPFKEPEFTVTLDFADDDTTITQATTINGIVMNLFFVVPALDGTQCTLSFLNSNNREYYGSGLVDEGTTHLLTDVGVAMVKPTIKIVTADSQLADRVFYIEPVYG